MPFAVTALAVALVDLMKGSQCSNFFSKTGTWAVKQTGKEYIICSQIVNLCSSA
jgi:hypothetical protein